MSVFVNCFLSLIPLVACLGIAQAQEHGKFHLPFDAQWGGMTLAAGDYKVELPQLALGTRTFFIDGGNSAKGFVNPAVTDVFSNANASNRSYLQLVKVDGEFFVAQYHSAAKGTTYSFPVPKPRHRVQMSQRETVKLDVARN